MTEALDIQDLIDAGLIADPDQKVRPEVRFAAKTDMGMVRENNEDKFDFYEPDDAEILGQRGCLYAVSDGMGGAAAGQVASEQTLNMVIEAYYKYYNTHSNGKPIGCEEALECAVRVANGVVKEYGGRRPDWKGMGATLTCLILVRNQAYVGHVGDSRAYLIRDEHIRQVTQDHSWVEEQVRSGILTREEAEASPYRNIITRSIGTLPLVEPDVYLELAKPGDIWVLCTDGLTTYLTDEEVRCITLAMAPAEAVRKLIQVAKDRGGRDNITVAIVSVRDFSPLPLE